MARLAPFGLDEKVIPNIALDWEAYIDIDGDDIVYGIYCIDELADYADLVRNSFGFQACFRDLGNGIDDEGYYDYYITADKNGIKDFYFVASVSDEDDWGEYFIPMTDSFKAKLFEKLNELSAARCGGTVRELIEEEENYA